MCGICGFVGKIDEEVKVIEQMAKVITHRGPNDVNFFVDNDVAMGFRRLSIIDVSEGRQPIYNENNNLVLTFNGEIYNFLELKHQLESLGHKFYTHTDTEVIVHGFEEWGESVTLKLRGMFAFAIWNREEKSIFLARDHFGIKPLHYCMCENNFIYASEIKSILEFPKFEKKLNMKAFDNYLSFQYVPEPETIFENIYCLQPGHFMWYKDSKIKIRKFFEPILAPDETLDFEKTVSNIENAVKESVDAHKVSDVPVGCFLSSGVDSSYVASFLTGHQSFTVGFEENENYNETKYAQDLSEKIGTKNINKIISADEYWGAIKDVQYFMDQPLADPSCVALYFVCKLAREHVTVVLSGEGADEFFGGYQVYNQPRVFKFYQKFLSQSIRTWLANFVKKIPFKFKGRGFIIRGEKKIEDKFIGNANIFSKDEKKEILKDRDIATNPMNFVRPYYDKFKKLDSASKMQNLDINLWMVGDILLKADRMSMANSLELRVPLLDRNVFEVAKTLPSKFKTPKENTKFAFRKAASKSLPGDAAQKPKLGFPIPIRVWLRQKKYYEIVREAFTSKTARKFFIEKKICTLLREHYEGKEDFSRKIWTIYTFIIWYDIYLGE